MNEIHQSTKSVESELLKIIEDFLEKLQTSQPIEAEFDTLYKATGELVRSLHGQELVSKSTLRTLYETFMALHHRSEQSTDNETLEDMADKLSTCFTLILRNDLLENRIPGVPRII